MNNLMLPCLITFSISLIANWIFIKQAKKIGLVAHPGGHRMHAKATPLVGGLAMFIAIIVGVMFYSDWQSFEYFMYALTLIMLIGLMDDKFQLPYLLRFLSQAITIYIFIKYSGVQLFDLGDLFGNGVISLNRWSIFITIFSVIGVINAINMTDGLDGLAGCMSLLSLSALLILGITDELLVLIIMSAVCGFLIFNLRVNFDQARAFMGDAGSLMIGFILAILLIDNSQGTARVFAPVTALWFLALPLIDAVAVMIVRPIKGQSPFVADRIHYHHLLTNTGMSVNQALVILLLIQCVFIAIGFFCIYLHVAEYIQFYMFLLLFVVYFIFLIKKTH